MRSYTFGNELVFVTRFRDPVTCQAVIPDTVVLTLQAPDGTRETPLVSTTEPGVYRARYTPLMPGLWRERWVSTGAVQAADENQFEVRPSF